jgi:hypothetical protein
MRYPRINPRGQKCFIKMPFLLTSKIWIEVFLFDNKKIKQASIVFYHNKSSCQESCNQHNVLNGFTPPKVKKIINKYFHEING